MTHPGRPRLLAAAGAVLLLSSCGLPGAGTARSVDDETVPYALLDSGSPAPGTPDGDPTALGSVPLVFWLDNGGVLVPSAAAASCDDQIDTLVAELLGEVAAGPAEDARAAGRSTAIPPASVLTLVGIDGGTATLQVEPGSEISADLLPLAAGQIVLAMTSASGVDEVALVRDGEPVQIPLPGGALTSDPVGASDYAALVPERYLSATPSGIGLRPGIGCPIS